jgi:hypothetical protein
MRAMQFHQDAIQRWYATLAREYRSVLWRADTHAREGLSKRSTKRKGRGKFIRTNTLLMTKLEKVEALLTREPRARERKYKDNAIRQLLLERYPELKTIGKETLIAALQDYASYDRAWRKVLQDIPSLRGSDYDDGHRLAVEKMDELGYNVQPANYTKV